MATKEQEYCIYCDKPLKKVQYVNFEYATEPIAPDAEPEHGQYGYHPVGMDCAKKRGIPKAWIFTREDFKRIWPDVEEIEEQ